MDEPAPPASETSVPRLEKLRTVLNTCKKMSSVGDIISLLDHITTQAAELLEADRASIFLLDREKCELWSIITHEEKKRMVMFDARLGIAGAAAMSGQTINVADAYEHPLFFKEVDQKIGYRTKTLLAVPIMNAKGEIIGVGEAINKKVGMFTDEDAEILRSLAAHICDATKTTHIDTVLTNRQQREGNDEIGGEFSTRNIIGMSYRIQSVVRLIDQIRDSSVDVMIQGESGTGKELVAKALHYNSPRSKQPFVAVNCAALPDSIVEAELFGIERGIATGVDRRIGKFEEAQGGTLFLDEIGDLSLPSQAKILRVLQERSVTRVGARTATPLDLRIIAATNKDLEREIKDGHFRVDLYYRLKVIHIETPALREVPEDIPLLATHFLEKYSKLMKTEPKQFTPAALECMASYGWPGNERQLENEVRRLVASVRGKIIAEEHIDPSIRSSEKTLASSTIPSALKTPQTETAPETSRPL
ncbi:MAG TPA: sigma-54-dependent Fis family transcriptional regulator, partial [Candidatus Binatia bacterium]